MDFCPAVLDFRLISRVRCHAVCSVEENAWPLTHTITDPMDMIPLRRLHIHLAHVPRYVMGDLNCRSDRVASVGNLVNAITDFRAGTIKLD